MNTKSANSTQIPVLDIDGVKVLWDKVKELVSSSGTETDGIPVKYILRSDFDQLPDESKQNVLYIVDNGADTQAQSITPLSESEADGDSFFDYMPIGSFVATLLPGAPPPGWIDLGSQYLDYYDHPDFGYWCQEKYGDPAPWGWVDEWRSKANLPGEFNFFFDYRTLFEVAPYDYKNSTVSPETQIGVRESLSLPKWSEGEESAKAYSFKVRFLLRVDKPKTLSASGSSGDGTDTPPAGTSRYELYFNGVRIYMMGGTSTGGDLSLELEGKELRLLQNGTPLSSVTLPDQEGLGAIPITTSEYEALSESDRENKLYLVTDADATKPLVGLSVTDYDTEDGWHVRKWSDGYVEMTYRSETILEASMALNAFGALFSTSADFIPEIVYPFPLTEKYYEGIDLWQKTGANLSAWPYAVKDRTSNPLNHTRRHGLVFVVNNPRSEDCTYEYAFHVTGRWK